jgi:hypothetical protein
MLTSSTHCDRFEDKPSREWSQLFKPSEQFGTGLWASAVDRNAQVQVGTLPCYKSNADSHRGLNEDDTAVLILSAC